MFKITLKNNLIINLFLVFFKIGASSFGGGMAMISVVEREIVENKKWLTKDEFIDAIIVAQSLPGIIIINLAVYVGYKLNNLKGAIASLFGSLAPSVIIMMIISMTLSKFTNNIIIQKMMIGIGAVSPALILLSAVSLLKSIDKNKYVIGTIVVFTTLLIFKVNPMLIILFGITLGIVTKEVKMK